MIVKKHESPSLKQTIRIYTVFTRLSACLLVWCVATLSCTHQPGTHHGAHMGSENTSVVNSVPNDRLTLELSPSKAEDITRNQLGFSKHREATRRQQTEAFPPAYHDLAMAHHEVAEELAHVIPSQDFKQILLKLDRTLKAYVACHRAFEL